MIRRSGLLLAALWLFLALALPKSASASHNSGGVITWECVKSGSQSGMFRLTIKLYRTCYQGAATLGNSNILFNPLYIQYGGPTTITCNRIGFSDISLSCYNSSNRLKCGTSLSGANPVPKKVGEYVSGYVQIMGVPDKYGSEFYLSNCCRPNLINIPQSSESRFRRFGHCSQLSQRIFPSNRSEW